MLGLLIYFRFIMVPLTMAYCESALVGISVGGWRLAVGVGWRWLALVHLSAVVLVGVIAE